MTPENDNDEDDIDTDGIFLTRSNDGSDPNSGQHPLYEPTRNTRSRTYVLRLLIALLLLSCITYVIIDFRGDRKVESILIAFLEWTHEHPYKGIIAVILCYIVATVLFVPGSILTFGAGFAIGSAFDNMFLGVFLATAVRLLKCMRRNASSNQNNGSVVTSASESSLLLQHDQIFLFVPSQSVFIGASIGSICSFLLGRYLFRDCVLQLAFSYPIFQAIER